MPGADRAETWTSIQRELRAAVTDSTFHLWLEPLRLVEVGDGELLVGAPDGMRGWVSDRYTGLLERAAATVLGSGARVRVVGLDESGGEITAPAARPAPTPAPERHAPAARATSFNPKYTFEQFVIGDANRLAHAAALSVAELPAQAYNPLFLYGPPGLGKTHLLHAIANYLSVNEPGLAVRYTTAEAFTTHFVQATGTRGAMDPFKALYRDADVLLIDDVQFLAAKARTEEEFFHTFDALYEAGAQLVLTSDRLPGDLDALEDRLRARFESGLVSDVGAPDMATRMTILRKRVAHDGIALDDDAALARIAERIPHNIRALEGALIRVVAFHSLTGRPLDAELVEEVLSGLYPDQRPVRRSVADVQHAVCEAFGVSRDELCSSTRASRVAWPRQVGMYLARELTDASLPAIGKEFGGRNHATVLHACRRTSQRIAGDREAFDAVNNLSERLRRDG